MTNWVLKIESEKDLGIQPKHRVKKIWLSTEMNKTLITSKWFDRWILNLILSKFSSQKRRLYDLKQSN